MKKTQPHHAATTARKVDSKLITEDFKKYEDKTAKKISQAKRKPLRHCLERRCSFK